MARFIVISFLVLAAFVSAVPARAADQDPQQAPAEHRNRKGLIEPTSNGSSGAASGAPAGPTDGVDEGTVGGSSQSQNDAGSFGVSGGGSSAPNPYPNATDRSGQIVGGSVNGTGALNSAHPGP